LTDKATVECGASVPALDEHAVRASSFVSFVSLVVKAFSDRTNCSPHSFSAMPGERAALHGPKRIEKKIVPCAAGVSRSTSAA
jgi:hypothetical protein